MTCTTFFTRRRGAASCTASPRGTIRLGDGKAALMSAIVRPAALLIQRYGLDEMMR